MQWCWPISCFSRQFLGSSSFNVHPQFILIYVENIAGTDICYGPAPIIAGQQVLVGPSKLCLYSHVSRAIYKVAGREFREIAHLVTSFCNLAWC